MKNFKKSAVFMSLAAFMIVTGCGGNSGSKAGDSASNSGSAGSKTTLKFMTQSSPLAPADPNDKLIFKRMEEKTGIHID